MIKSYKKYIISTFSKTLLKVYGIVTALIIIINIFEEINFLNKSDVNILYPVLLSILNTPSLVYEVSPFIFLIATQFLFIKLIENNELQIFKYAGLTNLDILKTLSTFCLILGIVIVLIFYNFSAKLKNYYLELKNNESNDNKYLAVITENGLWIKDEIDNHINIINAEKIINNYLINTTISQFNKNFNLLKNIDAKKIDISKKQWIIIEGKLMTKNEIISIDGFNFNSNFDAKRINSYFSNLSSLNIFQLLHLKKEYSELNFSTVDINAHLHKISSFPIYITIMSIFSAVMMFNIKYQKNTVINIIIGVFFSVLIYYLNYIINVMGIKGAIPIVFSVWLPLLILTIFNSIWIVRLNEK